MTILNSNSQLALTASTFVLLLLSILAVILHTSVLISIAWDSLVVTETLHFDFKDFGVYVLPEHLDASSSKLALYTGPRISNPERSHRGHYHEGTFDFEAWTCQVVRYSDVYSDEKCKDARAGRVVQILIFVVALVAMWVGRWELREGGKRGEGWKGERLVLDECVGEKIGEVVD
ncbi:hypothetical protein BOTNAR_0374g00140 [Botryotinia narcissicola]|uniref:Uncharacterized protein n=1 Tax=Botryotinia narcissicola TaxID=278944 RepID=A0A4Z1HPY1_9HELO|nr:hypothetical protein BOTNAR_0374g00140 [Botryotinia narcissicola]